MRDTIATVPGVRAVLWSLVSDTILIVTILRERSDEAILRVAEQELALMDRMRDHKFEFRTAEPSDLDAYLASGYVPIVENRDDDNSPTA